MQPTAAMNDTPFEVDSPFKIESPFKPEPLLEFCPNWVWDYSDGREQTFCKKHIHHAGGCEFGRKP